MRGFLAPICGFFGCFDPMGATECSVLVVRRATECEELLLTSCTVGYWCYLYGWLLAVQAVQFFASCTVGC